MADIDKIQIQIDAEAKNATTAIDKLQLQLSKLAKSMETISASTGFSNLEKITSNLRSLSSVNISQDQIKNVSNLAHAVSKFGNKGVSSAIANMPLLSNGLRDLSSTITGVDANASGLTRILDMFSRNKGLNSNFDVSGLANLFDTVSRLGNKKSNNAISNIPVLSSEIKQLVTELNSVNYAGVSGLGELVSGISRLGGKTSTQAINNIPALTSALNNMMATLSRSPVVSQNLINMTNAMANFASQGQKISSASKILSTNLNSSVSTMSNSASKGVSAFGRLSKAIGKFYAEFFLIIRAFKALWRSIESSMDYIETYNYFDAAFGQVADAAEKSWQEAGYDNAKAYTLAFEEKARQLTQKMSGYVVGENGLLTNIGGKSLGMNPDTLLNANAQFSQISSSMGVASDYAVKLGDAMTRLGADLASVKNENFDETYRSLTSSLTGAARAADAYGVNIRNANLQQKLAEIGISTSITKLGQNDKALLRTMVILDSTRYAWADLSDTLSAPSNQLRMLKANFEGLGRTIGGIFLGSVAKVLPYINGLVMALQRLAQWFTTAFGIEIPTITSQSSGAVTDFLDDMEDGMDGATGKAKKLKNALLGIDELNVLSKNDDSGSGSGASGADTAAIQAAFDAIYDEYIKAWEDAYANVKNESQTFADGLISIASTAAKAISDGFNQSFQADTDSLGLNIARNINSWNRILSNEDVKKSAQDYLDSLGEAFGASVGSVTSIGTSLMTGITGGMADSLEKNEPFITQKLSSIYDNMTKINNTTIDLSDALANIGTVFEGESFQKLVSFFTDLYTVVDLTVLDAVTGFFSDLYDDFSRPIVDNADEIKEVLDKIFQVTNNLLGPAQQLIDLITENSGKYQDSSFHNFMQQVIDFDTQRTKVVLDFLNDLLDVAIDLTDGYNLDEWVSPLGFLKDEFDDWNVNVSEWVDENITQPFKNSKIGTFLSDDVKQGFDDISKRLSSAKQRFQTFGHDIFVIMKDKLQPAIDWVKTNVFDKVTELTGKVKMDFSIFASDIKTKFSYLSNWFKDTFLDPLKERFSDFSDKVKGFFGDIWTDSLNGGVDFANKLIGVFENFINSIIGKFNDKIEDFNNAFSNTPGFVSLSSISEVTIPRINGYANGGFPSAGEIFVANEAGPELVGTVGGRNSVASNNEITGISETIRDTSSEEIALLRQQNELLTKILSKDYEVSTNGLLKEVRKGARTYKKTTGNDAFAF